MLGLFPLKILVAWGREYLCSKVLYAQKLSEGTTEQPSMQSVTAGKQSETSLSQGWAIRQTKKAARFNENQRSYLDEKFLIGQSTGIKADPSQVATRPSKRKNWEWKTKI